MPLALRLALRELRSGVRGFRIFLACLALGVAAIAAAGSTAEAFRAGLAAQAREILGGDVSVALAMRRFTPAEQAVLARAGSLDYAVSVGAMAQTPSGERHLVDLRGVSERYPLTGQVGLSGGMTLRAALAPRGGVAAVAVEQSLLDRLHLKLGDRLLIGNVSVVATAVLLSEPDRLSRGFALGSRVLAPMSMVEAGGFLDSGAPYGETARIALAPGRTLKDARTELDHSFSAIGAGGFHLHDRNDATPGLRRLLDELEYFLGFIGLAALVAGGLGVFGAVTAYLDAKTASIAVLKALGAEGPLVRDVYLIQIGVLAAAGVAIGLIVGGATPLVLGAVVGDSLPIPALFAVYPAPLVKAGAFGLLSAAAFGLAPLGRARVTPPAVLFRGAAPARAAWGPEMIGALAAGGGLAALAVATAPTPMAAAVMIAGVIVAFAGLWTAGSAAAALAGRGRRRARGAVRIALANLAGPGSAARSAAPAMGLGVALMSAVVLIQSSLLAQVSIVAPRSAPSLVFTAIPAERAAAFDAVLARAMGRALTPSTYLRAPFSTGRITAVRGAVVDATRIPEADRWAYDNDISLSAVGPAPRDAGVVAGAWWPASYAGPPLVALSQEAAKGGRIKVGDRVTLSILGRDVPARVAALRKIDAAGFGLNFPIVMTPDALAGAPVNQVAIAKATRAEEARVARALGADFPQVNVISVREQLTAAADVFDRLALAVRAAAAVAAVAGLLVLAGAISAGARSRAREAAILKVLGAARGQILAIYGLEYGAVGFVAGTAGVGLGYLAAWPVVTLVFKAMWSVDWGGAAALVAGAAGVCACAGWLAARQALAQRPAATLRAG